MKTAKEKAEKIVATYKRYLAKHGFSNCDDILAGLIEKELSQAFAACSKRCPRCRITKPRDAIISSQSL